MLEADPVEIPDSGPGLLKYGGGITSAIHRHSCVRVLKVSGPKKMVGWVGRFRVHITAITGRVLLPVARYRLLPDYTPGRALTMALRIAMMMVRN